MNETRPILCDYDGEIARFEWHSEWNDALLKQVYRDHVPIINTPGSCVMDGWEGEALDHWRQHVLTCLSIFPERGDLHQYAVISRHDPARSEDEWARGYPHAHSYAYRTLVHYLDPGAGAPLVVMTDVGDPLLLRPKVGMSVVFRGALPHGFHNWEGPPRVALVVQQVPQGTRRITRNQ